MANTLDKVEEKKIHVVDVVKHGEKLVLPENMTAGDAITALQRFQKYETEQTIVGSTFDYFPWDGAYALFIVLKRRYGWATMEAVYSFFGKELPRIVEIEVDCHRTVGVPWGRISLFGNEGYIDMSATKVNGRFVFYASATVMRKHEKLVREIYQEVRDELSQHSIYRGKCLSIRFRDDEGTSLPLPDARFVSTVGAHKSGLIFSQEVQDSIETNLFTPIERMADCKRAGIPVKRGILLAGVFGTGKTLAARVAAALATNNAITFIYCKRADEFAEAVQFALQYGPAVVFCEDIDRVLSGERSVEMDDILNIIDGIDTKASEIIIVLTTNQPDKLNPASVRPGRLDAVIDVKKPDAHAVERLIVLYGGRFLVEGIDLSHVGEILAGNIPAVIEEVVKRSKLAALKFTPPGSAELKIDARALEESAKTMKMQLDLLNPPVTAVKNDSLKSLLEPIIKDVIEAYQNA